jgi:hypothetical protein
MKCDYCKNKIKSNSIIYKAYDYTYCSNTCKMEKINKMLSNKSIIPEYKSGNINEPIDYSKTTNSKYLKKTNSYAVITPLDHIGINNHKELQNKIIILDHKDKPIDVPKNNFCLMFYSFLRKTCILYLYS